MSGLCGVYIIKEPGNVEEEESPCVTCGPCGLDMVDQGGNGIDGGVVGSGAKLRHGQQVSGLDVAVDVLGNDLL